VTNKCSVTGNPADGGQWARRGKEVGKAGAEEKRKQREA
jgi:hypothetical protein